MRETPAGPIRIDGTPLTLEELVAVGNGAAVEVGDLSAMQPARAVVEAALASGEVVYGITTGFGALADTRIEPDQAAALSLNLLRSHAAGVGAGLDRRVVRAMLASRARTLAAGYSGTGPRAVQLFAALLNADAVPFVPEQGSVGASGDLAPLAHAGLALCGEGLMDTPSGARPAASVLRDLGLEPLRPGPKEGLALTNGTDGMLALAALALHDAERLAEAADAVCAMTLDALLGTDVAYDARVIALRPHPGQAVSAARLRDFLAGSQIRESHRRDTAHAVQDAYSLRCAPQVHGATRDALAFVRTTVERELAAVIDNPVVFAQGEPHVVSAGNFHGAPLALALDVLAVALANLASISERRTDRLLDPTRSAGLPPFLATDAGTRSGLMLAQYTAAALVAELRVLAGPASTGSIPTSGGREDHVSMGFTAGLKARRAVGHAVRVLAVEALCAAAGLDFRAPLQPSPDCARFLAAIRDVVPPFTEDRPPGPAIEAIVPLLLDGRVG